MVSERITIDPWQMGGVACIRGLRIPVAKVVAMLADGMGVDEIAALHKAAGSLRVRESPLLRVP